MSTTGYAYPSQSPIIKAIAYPHLGDSHSRQKGDR